MRAVAAAMDVTPMALYRCFDSAESLRRASISAVLERMPGPPDEGSVADRLGTWADSTRRRLRTADGLAAACIDDWPTLPGGCRMMESLLAVAAEHTESTIHQCEIATAVFGYAVSRAIVDRAVLTRRRERRLPAVEARPVQYPRLAALDHRCELIDLDRAFAAGLDALLTGLLERRTA